MSCKICGRGNCSESFHSIREQDEYDEVAGKILERMKEVVKRRLDMLDYEVINDEAYINLESACDIIEDYY